MTTDGELVRQALGGRTAACADLAHRWSARVLAFCHARVGRADVAEDLAQETLLRGFRSLSSLQSPEKFGPWLRGIAQRVCLDWFKSKRNGTVPLTARDDGSPRLATDAEAAVRDVDRDDEVRRLMAEVEALPEEYREALMLFYYDDLSYREAAQLLGVSSATINVRLTKARALLRERLSSSRR